MDNILASSLNGKDHLAAFDAMIKSRFAEIDFSSVLSNILNIAPVEALPYLAMQRGVTGYNGWRYAVTEADQRTLLANGIEIHKYKGTQGSIEDGLKQIGVTPVTFVKGNYPLYYNDEQFMNGSFYYGDSNPFIVQIQVSYLDFPVITAQNAIDIVAIVKEFKSARDYIVSLNQDTGNQNDTITHTDVLALTVTNAGVPANYTL